MWLWISIAAGCTSGGETGTACEGCDTAPVEDSAEPEDTGNPDGPCSEPTVTFVRDDGIVEDYTSELSDGTYVTLKFPGELQVCPGTWFARIVLEDDVRVIGLGETREDTVLSGGEQGTVLDITDGSVVEVEHLTLDRGLATEIEHNSGGGGLYCEQHSSVRVEDVVFSNGGGNDAGGLYAYECEVEVVNAEFHGNEVEDDGGAVSLWLTTASFEGVSFWDNTALDGGALAMFSSTVTIRDATFEGNLATNFAGAIWVYQSELTMSDSVIAGNGNLGGLSGGGLLVYGDAVLDNVTAYDNEGPVGGGLFVEVDSSVVATSSSFTTNSPDDVYVADYSEKGGTAYSDIEGDFSCASSSCDGLGSGR